MSSWGIFENMKSFVFCRNATMCYILLHIRFLLICWWTRFNLQTLYPLKSYAFKLRSWSHFQALLSIMSNMMAFLVSHHESLMRVLFLLALLYRHSRRIILHGLRQVYWAFICKLGSVRFIFIKFLLPYYAYCFCVQLVSIFFSDHLAKFHQSFITLPFT